MSSTIFFSELHGENSSLESLICFCLFVCSFRFVSPLCFLVFYIEEMMQSQSYTGRTYTFYISAPQYVACNTFIAKIQLCIKTYGKKDTLECVLKRRIVSTFQNFMFIEEPIRYPRGYCDQIASDV